MASEDALWRCLHRKLSGPGRHLVRIENEVGCGDPDVNYCLHGSEGWIELKHLRRWPVRASTVVRLPHFTQQQRGWLRARSEAGGRVFLLLQVEREYLLFDGRRAQAVGYLVREQLYEACCGRWRGSLDALELIELLRV